MQRYQFPDLTSVLLLSLLLLTGRAPQSSAQDAPPTLEPGTHHYQLTVNGVRRDYQLHVPPAYDGKQSVPLVMLLHGRGGSAEEADRTYGMSEKADKEGFLVVYPDGRGVPQTWNAGLVASESRADDSAFLRALLQKLLQTLVVDRRKVFVAGHDSGAMMAYRLAAEFSTRIAAVGVVAGATGVKAKIGGSVTIPRPARPLSVIAFHGKKDNVVPYDGGTYLSARASIAFWVRQNDCSEPVQREVSEDGNVTRETYTGCDEETEVTLYTIRDGDHRWPGARDPRPYAPPPTTKISATDLMWAFFARHHR